MNQDKIANFIKEVRKKDKLSQEKFGEKYGVTYQAVSKWETGKNLPDISILKEICNDYNKDINELINDNGSFHKKKRTLKIVVSTIIILLVIITLGIYIISNHKESKSDGFQFKTIKTTCNNFKLFGSIAYDDSKTSIHISNITYCGTDNDKKYKEIECTFYEIDGDAKIKIDSYKHSGKEINLEEFLEEVRFNVEHYSDSCKMYKENALLLEIKATDKNDQTIFYDLPLELEENCK